MTITLLNRLYMTWQGELNLWKPFIELTVSIIICAY